MKQKSELKIIEIPTKLIGQNKVVGPYEDDYLRQINKSYDFNKIMEQYKFGLLKADPKELTFFTMDSPAQNDQAEDILREILYDSAHSDKWVGHLILHDDPKYVFNRFETKIIRERSSTPLEVGLYHARESGLVLLTGTHAGPNLKYIVAIPSQTFIENCAARIKGEMK